MAEVPLTFTDYREMKSKIHSQILQEMDLEGVNKLQEDVARARVCEAIRELLHRDRTPLAFSEREQLVKEVVNELFGLGPIEPLLADSRVSDILVNGPDRIYVERDGVLQRTDLFFNDSQHLLQIIDRIVSRVGRRVDESSPMVDARLLDGSRVNAIIPPLALDGPSVSIRRFGGHKLSAQAFIANGTLTKTMLDVLEGSVKGSQEYRRSRPAVLLGKAKHHSAIDARRTLEVFPGVGQHGTLGFFESHAFPAVSKTLRNCVSTRSTLFVSRRVLRISKAKAPSGSGSW